MLTSVYCLIPLAVLGIILAQSVNAVARAVRKQGSRSGCARCGYDSIRFLDANYAIAGHRLPPWVNTDALIALAAIPFVLLALLGIAMTQLRRRWLIRAGRRDAERAISARAQGDAHA